MTRWWDRFGGAAVDARRWIVLDVESSGLDPLHDRLLAIAAIAVHRDAGRPRIAFGDSFEVVLRQGGDAAVDKANILVHGIGAGAQRGGAEAAEALGAFERWVAGAPLVAFHAAFDEALVRRAMVERLGRQLAGPWLDLARVARAARPDLAARSLDEWMDAYGVRCARRHQAAADTLATAELLLKLWPAIVAQGVSGDWRALVKLAAHSRWLPR